MKDIRNGPNGRSPGIHVCGNRGWLELVRSGAAIRTLGFHSTFDLANVFLILGLFCRRVLEEGIGQRRSGRDRD